MSLMGKTLVGLGLAAFLMGAGPAYAQQPEDQGKPQWQQGQGRHHGGHKGKFMESLNLSEQQKEQLKGLRELSREERAARMKEILTPEQYAKFEEMKSKRGQRGPGGKGPFADLNLTEQQKAQMKELRSLSAEERQARLQQILTPEQLARVQAHQEEFKSKMGQRQQRFAQELGLSEQQQQQIKAAFQEMHKSGQGMSRDERRTMMRDKLQSILTPEQFQKFEQMKKDHPRGGRGRQG
jgi:Spy/CpxP family protein refolding chaperone